MFKKGFLIPSPLTATSVSLDEIPEARILIVVRKLEALHGLKYAIQNSVVVNGKSILKDKLLP